MGGHGGQSQRNKSDEVHICELSGQEREHIAMYMVMAMMIWLHGSGYRDDDDDDGRDGAMM